MMVLPSQVREREPRLAMDAYEPTALVVLGVTGLESARVPCMLTDPAGTIHRVEASARIIQYGMTRVHYRSGGLWWGTMGGTGEVRRLRPSPYGARVGRIEASFVEEARGVVPPRRHIGSGMGRQRSAERWTEDATRVPEQGTGDHDGAQTGAPPMSTASAFGITTGHPAGFPGADGAICVAGVGRCAFRAQTFCGRRCKMRAVSWARRTSRT